MAFTSYLFSFSVILRILDHVEESKQAKQVDAEEGENVKQQVEMYKAAKLAIEEQRRKVCFLPLSFSPEQKKRIETFTVIHG